MFSIPITTAVSFRRLNKKTLTIFSANQTATNFVVDIHRRSSVASDLISDKIKEKIGS